jgi:DNA repair exonuclease SbcCD ATPase subunit
MHHMPPGGLGWDTAALRADNTMQDRWMTYQEAATALRMTPESIRARARREHWRKQLGNDGKALILVPVDATSIVPGEPDDYAPASRPVKRPEPDPVALALQARISDLETRASELAAQVDRERSERLQERERADRLTDEVANLARLLASTVDESAARERALHDQIGQAKEARNRLEAEADKAQSELAEWKARPWWQRLAG